MANIELKWNYMDEQPETSCPVYIAWVHPTGERGVVHGYYEKRTNNTEWRWWSDMYGFIHSVYAWAPRDEIAPPPPMPDGETATVEWLQDKEPSEEISVVVIPGDDNGWPPITVRLDSLGVALISNLDETCRDRFPWKDSMIMTQTQLRELANATKDVRQCARCLTWFRAFTQDASFAAPCPVCHEKHDVTQKR